VDATHLTLEKGMTVNINKLHLLLGHACEKILKATAEHYDLKVTGEYKVCTDCALAKARQKNVPKESAVVSSKPGELFYLDISSTKARSIGGSKFWLLIINHFSDMCWSFFMKNKSDLPDRVMELLQLLHRDKLISGKPKIGLDNSGENQALEVRMRSDSVGAIFEFTAPGSHQFAGVVERKFATLFARVRSILNSARLSQDLCNGLWAEAAKYATDVENSLITGSRQASSWSMFYKKESPIIRNLRQFGEIAILDNHQKRGFHSKLENRGYAALYLGHADNHASDVYRFLNLETKCVVRSRDCTWLNKTYASYKEIEGVVLITDDDDDVIDSTWWLPLLETIWTITLISENRILTIQIYQWSFATFNNLLWMSMCPNLELFVLGGKLGQWHHLLYSVI
jgi:hypothetical protein